MWSVVFILLAEICYRAIACDGVGHTLLLLLFPCTLWLGLLHCSAGSCYIRTWGSPRIGRPCTLLDLESPLPAVGGTGLGSSCTLLTDCSTTKGSHGNLLCYSCFPLEMGHDPIFASAWTLSSWAPLSVPIFCLHYSLEVVSIPFPLGYALPDVANAFPAIPCSRDAL